MPRISCVVDHQGHVSASQEAGAELSSYDFDLIERKLLSDRTEGAPAELNAAREFFERCAGTPEKLIEFAKAGRLEKLDLADLIRPEKRQGYLNACGEIERDCVRVCEPCLEGGCAAAGETCLQACVRAGAAYDEACAAAWVPLFSDPNNRIASWRT